MNPPSPLAFQRVFDNEVGSTSLEVDPYAPLTFRSPAGTGNGFLFIGKGSCLPFVELWVDLSSGRLTRAALVGSVVRQVARATPRLVPRESGLPALDTSAFPTDSHSAPIIELDDVVTVDIEGSALFARWSQASADFAISCGRAIFLVTADQLSGFGVTDLTAEERALLFE